MLRKADIESLIRELGRRCATRGFSVEMFLVGGAAMALAYRRERTTRDLDAVFEPKTSVYDEVHRIADERGLPRDWLNDAVKGLLPDRGDRPGEQVSFVSEGISVAIASPEYLLATKAFSARAEGDTEDFVTLARLLGITDADQALSVLERYYRPERLTAKSSLFVQSVYEVNDLSEPHQGAEREVFVSAHTRDGRPVAAHWRKKPPL